MKARTQRKNYAAEVTSIVIPLALGLIAYFAFNAISGLRDSVNTQSAYRSLALNSLLAAAGLAVRKLPEVLLDESSRQRLGPGIIAVGYVLAGLGAWRGLAAFELEAWIMPRLGLVVLSVCSGMALSHLAEYAERGTFGRFLHWLGEKRSLIVPVILFVAGYALLIHPSFATRWEYASLTEWFFVTAAAIVILTASSLRLRHGMPEGHGLPVPTRHRQSVEAKTDAYYSNVRNLERRFIKEADRTLLLYYLAVEMNKNWIDEKKAAHVLLPLCKWRGHSKGRDGRVERERLLVEFIGELQKTLQPSRDSLSSTDRDGREEVGEEDAPRELNELVEHFRQTGERNRLIVRLSILMSSAATRPEDVEEVLKPLISADADKLSSAGRSRLWHDTVLKGEVYTARLQLKE